jgi:hypothetical protein
VGYYHEGKLDRPRLGYLLEKDGKVFLTAINENGEIVTFHYLEKGWPYVENKNVFFHLFKINAF